jgi:hypothetical protein
MKKTTLILAMALILCSCAPAATPQALATLLPTYTPFPTYTPYPTYTPLPTNIPAATVMPTVPPPTAPASQTTSADAVLKAFQAAGIPISNIVVLTADSDSNKLLGRPNQYIAKVVWKDSRISTSGDPGIDTGGTLELFLNTDDLQVRKQYIEAITKSSIFAEYTYARGVMLLRLSHELTPDQAKGYEDVFVELP